MASSEGSGSSFSILLCRYQICSGKRIESKKQALSRKFTTRFGLVIAQRPEDRNRLDRIFVMFVRGSLYRVLIHILTKRTSFEVLGRLPSKLHASPARLQGMVPAPFSLRGRTRAFALTTVHR